MSLWARRRCHAHLPPAPPSTRSTKLHYASTLLCRVSVQNLRAACSPMVTLSSVNRARHWLLTHSARCSRCPITTTRLRAAASIRRPADVSSVSTARTLMVWTSLDRLTQSYLIPWQRLRPSSSRTQKRSKSVKLLWPHCRYPRFTWTILRTGKFRRRCCWLRKWWGVESKMRASSCWTSCSSTSRSPSNTKPYERQIHYHSVFNFFQTIYSSAANKVSL